MNIQYAFLKKENIPGRETLQKKIHSLGYNLKLDKEYRPFEDEGFSPCILNGDSSVGFEISYESALEFIDEDEEWKNIIGDNDFCISFSWGGSFGDLVCISIVCLALFKYYGATISYEGEYPETEKSILETINEGLMELENN